VTDRLLIASTPRSGNTWLRYQLADLLQLSQIAAHSPLDVAWESLPRRCVLQLHWLPTPDLAALLEVHDFKVIALSRHPLDVFVSILHFAPHEQQTARWLAGEGGDESAILGESPVSDEAVRYGCSKRFQALLNVSAQWWVRPQTTRVRYEDLVGNAADALEKLCAAFGAAAPDVRDVVDRHRLDRLREGSTNHHFWKGRPGLWRSLLTPEVVRAIHAANRSCFETLGYAIDPLPQIDRSTALASWRALA